MNNELKDNSALAEIDELRELNPREIFEIVKNLRPVNYELAIKIADKRKALKYLISAEYDLQQAAKNKHERDKGIINRGWEALDAPFCDNQLFHAKRLASDARLTSKKAFLAGKFYPEVMEIFSPEITSKNKDVFLQRIEHLDFFTSASEKGIGRLLVYRSNEYLTGDFPMWDKLPTLYKMCIMTLAMRAQCEQFHSVTLLIGKELNQAITPDTLKKSVDDLTKRIQKNINHHSYTNFRIWFSIEYSEKEDIGYHLHGFVGWDQGSEEKLRSILRKAVVEWVSNKNRQIKLNDKCVIWKEAIKQTFYALKAPVHIYASRATTQQAKEHYETLRNAIIADSAS